MNPSDDINVRIGLDASDLESGVNRARSSMGSLEKAFVRSQQAANNFGRSVVNVERASLEKYDVQIEKTKKQLESLRKVRASLKEQLTSPVHPENRSGVMGRGGIVKNLDRVDLRERELLNRIDLLEARSIKTVIGQKKRVAVDSDKELRNQMQRESSVRISDSIRNFDYPELKAKIRAVREEFIKLEQQHIKTNSTGNELDASLVRMSNHTLKNLETRTKASILKISNLSTEIVKSEEKIKKARSEGDKQTVLEEQVRIRKLQNDISKESIQIEKRYLTQIRKRQRENEQIKRQKERELRINQEIVNLATMVGGSLAVQQGLQTANELRRIQETTRVMLPTSDEFDRFMVQANEFSQEFNRPIFSTIEAFRQFLPIVRATANQTGVDMETLFRRILVISEQLGTLSPEQGVEGARIALQEFLAQEEESLIRRFELPVTRTQLTELMRQGPEAALEGLSRYLGEIGITEDKLEELGQTGVRGMEQLASSTKLLIATGMAPLEEILNNAAKESSNFINQIIEDEPELVKVIGTITTLGTALTALIAAMSGAAALGGERGVAGFFKVLTGGGGIKGLMGMASVKAGVLTAAAAGGVFIGNELTKFLARNEVLGQALSHVDSGLRATARDLERLTPIEIQEKFDLDTPLREIAAVQNELARGNIETAEAVSRLNALIEESNKNQNKKSPIEIGIIANLQFFSWVFAHIQQLVIYLQSIHHAAYNLLKALFDGLTILFHEFIAGLSTLLKDVLNIIPGFDDSGLVDFIAQQEGLAQDARDRIDYRGLTGFGPGGGGQDLWEYRDGIVRDQMLYVADMTGVLGDNMENAGQGAEKAISPFQRLSDAMNVTADQAEALVSAVEKYNNDVESTNEAHLQEIADINEEYADKQIEIAKRAREAAEEALQDLNDSTEDANRDLNRDMRKTERELNDDIQEERRGYLQQEVEDYRDHVRTLEEIMNKARQERDKALLDFDFRRIFEIMRDARQDVEDEQENFGIEQGEKGRQLDVKLQDMQREFEIERRERLIAYRESLQDLQIRYNREIRDTRAAQQQSLNDAAEYHRNALEMERTAYQERLALLREGIQKELELIMMSEEAKEAIRLRQLQQARDIMNGVFPDSGGTNNISVNNNVSVDAQGMSPDDVSDAVSRGVQRGNEQVFRYVLSSSGNTRVPTGWPEMPPGSTLR